VTFSNTSLKCAIQIELNSIVERAERISGLETKNQNLHFLTLRKKFTFFRFPQQKRKMADFANILGIMNNQGLTEIDQTFPAKYSNKYKKFYRKITTYF
jgi:hypothetical protein